MRKGKKDAIIDIRHGNLSSARTKMTENLSSSIDDESLRAFFEDYTDIIDAAVVGKPKGNFFLIDKNDVGAPFRFDIKDGLIDNIVQT